MPIEDLHAQLDRQALDYFIYAGERPDYTRAGGWVEPKITRSQSATDASASLVASSVADMTPEDGGAAVSNVSLSGGAADSAL
jgi:hypothetical protein